MKKTINVTARDIKKGVRANCFACPIALAAVRVIKKELHVSLRTIRIDPVASLVVIDLPPKAISFIERFDAKKPVKPFKFSIEV